MSAALLSVQGLCLDRAGRRVLDGVDFELTAGEHVLLVGRSGSGKSSLLRAIAGLLSPTSGRILLGGELASDGPRQRIPPAKRGIGYLFQGGALWPHMSVAKTLDFALQSSGLDRAARHQRAAEVLAECQLVGFDQRLPGSLSGGEAQRLALARALASRPKLLLLDEPLGPLDAELRLSLLETLETLRQRHGFAALHVTHDAGEARASSQRTLRLENGRLIAEDPREPSVDALGGLSKA